MDIDVTGPRVFKRLSVILLALTAAACATTPLPPPPPPMAAPSGQITIIAPYRAEDFAWSTRTGGNAIRGVSPKGYSCAGLAVGLTPEAPYSRERIMKLYGSAVRADRSVAEIRAKAVSNDKPELADFVRRARCDADGRFAFDGVPDGGYFLIAQVAAAQGPLALMRHVTLRGGLTLTVPLTITAAR